MGTNPQPERMNPRTIAPPSRSDSSCQAAPDVDLVTNQGCSAQSQRSSESAFLNLPSYAAALELQPVVQDSCAGAVRPISVVRIFFRVDASI